MGLENKQLQVAKELDDALLALVGLAKDLKAKKGVAEILAGSLPALIKAMEGLDQIDDELKANPGAFAATAGYRVGEVVGVFLAPSPVLAPKA